MAGRAPIDTTLLAGFNRLLSQTVERHKRYPRIALMRHWQGTAVLKVNIGADGRMRNYLLTSSSGYDALDQQALEMLREALPLPELPAQLAGLDLSIDVPVTFRIAD
jgi:protein TonB